MVALAARMVRNVRSVRGMRVAFSQEILDRPGRREAARRGGHGAMIAAERTSGHARVYTRGFYEASIAGPVNDLAYAT